METNRWSQIAALYAGTIFVGAFLLFQIQPLISRFILPWFGGTPAVWTTCLAFFQTALFAGYLYAHLSEHYLSARARTIVHLALIVAALGMLPITPSDWWRPADSNYPAARILALLAVCVGLPYFLLASTGPLVQAWFSQTLSGRSPYRLYSLSNLGSLLALLSYPFVVEPLFDGHQQSVWWSGGFALFAALSAAACWKTARLRGKAKSVAPLATEAFAEVSAERTASEPAPSWPRRLMWLLLPAYASALLLATTNHICLDMPSSPLLWVFPLSLYLLSFIIAFDHERWYVRLPLALITMIAAALTVDIYSHIVISDEWLGRAQESLFGVSRKLSEEAAKKPHFLNLWWPTSSYSVDLGIQLTELFASCMLCHGELVRLRPKSYGHLTSFYLTIAAGGALGGMLVGLVAPLVFKTYAEWKIGLVVSFVLAATVAFVLTKWRSWWNVFRAGGMAAAVLVLIVITYLLWHDWFSFYPVLEQSRDFYGVLTVSEQRPGQPLAEMRSLFHGVTQHGQQFVDEVKRQIPTAYYSKESGVGQALEHYQRAAVDTRGSLRVGVVGLGVGTLATYVNLPWDSIRFYEINPEVVRLAEKHFTYLSDARSRGAKVEIVVGDARLSLEREAKGAEPFDLIVLDAFSGDSIPIHLLTKEAFDIYTLRLAPEGAIAVHISNRSLNLAPVVYGLAEHFRLDDRQINSVDTKHAGMPSDWIVLSHNAKMLESLHNEEDLKLNPPSPPFPLWNDQRHNLLQILR